MAIYYTVFFIILNFIIYKLIKYNQKLSFHLILIILLFILLTFSIKLYKIFYVESSMMNGFTFFVLLTFTFLITIINLFQRFMNNRFQERLKNNEILSEFVNDLNTNIDYILIVTLLITFLQLFVIWSKIEL